MAVITERGSAMFPKYPYYVVAVITVGGFTRWLTVHAAFQVTTVYGDRLKYSQLKVARSDAQGLIDRWPNCDIVICMVDTIGFVSVAEYVHRHRLTTITGESRAGDSDGAHPDSQVLHP